MQIKNYFRIGERLLDIQSLYISCLLEFQSISEKRSYHVILFTTISEITKNRLYKKGNKKARLSEEEAR
jgi:hypothetical protein